VLSNLQALRGRGSMPLTSLFDELLRRVALEHEREVNELRAEVLRLRGGVVADGQGGASQYGDAEGRFDASALAGSSRVEAFQGKPDGEALSAACALAASLPFEDMLQADGKLLDDGMNENSIKVGGGRGWARRNAREEMAEQHQAKDLLKDVDGDESGGWTPLTPPRRMGVNFKEDRVGGPRTSARLALPKVSSLEAHGPRSDEALSLDGGSAMPPAGLFRESDEVHHEELDSPQPAIPPLSAAVSARPPNDPDIGILSGWSSNRPASQSSAARAGKGDDGAGTGGGSGSERGEDWKGILQERGRRWRPVGDDRVSIAMYIQSPRETASAETWPVPGDEEVAALHSANIPNRARSAPRIISGASSGPRIISGNSIPALPSASLTIPSPMPPSTAPISPRPSPREAEEESANELQSEETTPAETHGSPEDSALLGQRHRGPTLGPASAVPPGGDRGIAPDSGPPLVPEAMDAEIQVHADADAAGGGVEAVEDHIDHSL